MNPRFISGEKLPIAKARNKGIKNAEGDKIVYLNVDTVFSDNLIESMGCLIGSGKFITAPVHYVSEQDLRRGIKYLTTHGNSEGINSGNFNTSRDSEYCQLFGMDKADFLSIGGFDERYDGFGINDEDFLTSVRSKDIDIQYLEQPIFTKLREHYRCPLNHLLDFSRNSEIYRRKWKKYPCEAVLSRYAKEGFINKDFATKGIQIYSLPSTTISQDLFYQRSSLATYMDKGGI